MLVQGMDTGGLLVHGMDKGSLLDAILRGVIRLASRVVSAVRLRSWIT